MRNLVIGLAIWAGFMAAAAGRYYYEAESNVALPEVINSLFSQVQATETVSIPRRSGETIAGYALVKARFAVTASIRDSDATPIKPLIIDAMHAYFYEDDGDWTDADALEAYTAAAVAKVFGIETMHDLEVTLRYSAIAR